MNKTPIEWTHRPGTVGMTWDPIHFKRDDSGPTKTGNMCTRISPGCTHCYASTLNARWGNRLEYTVENLSKGHFYLDEKELQAPLKTKKPCTIFMADMFDLFHEAIPFSLIAPVLKVACEAKWHTLQFLTKRAARMFEFFSQWASMTRDFGPLWPNMWPQGHIWLGVSVESQKYADERIPLLLQTPAAVRFLSVEPQLEPVDLYWYLGDRLKNDLPEDDDGAPYSGKIDWIICGGESGPGARPFNLAWAESLREQCKAAGVAFFMKQVGSYPFDGGIIVGHAGGGTFHERQKLRDRKGGDPSEWPEQLRVREWPR